MASIDILAVLTGKTLTIVTSGLIFGCILVTYSLCLDEKNCPVFLPMISDTFVPIPGNFVSRMAFSAGQFGMAMVMVMDYFSYLEHRPASSKTQKVWLGLTLAATVCLGIVGAVCESDTAPTCLANGIVHVGAATYLYVSLDIYALYCAFTEHTRSAPTTHKVLNQLLPVVSTMLTILRWAPGIIGVLSPSGVALAVVEWTDTAVLMSWLVVHSCRTYYGGASRHP